MFEFPQVDFQTTHDFAPGIYARTVNVPAGAMVIGHRHNTAHLNVISKGKCRVLNGNGEVLYLQAPFIIQGNAGIRKVVFVDEDMTWTTIHPNPDNITDLDKLESQFIVKTVAALAFENKMKLEKGDQ